MSGKKYIIALDEGTTSCRAIVFDKDQNIKGLAQKEFRQHFPKPGWVEHDPVEIYSCQSGVLSEAIAMAGIDPDEIAGIGITNQRETTIVWDRKTGNPIYNAIVWQCRRSADIVRELEKKIPAEVIKAKTGLLPDAYYSATKLRWILDHVDGAQERAEKGELCFGTVDSWLIWKLTDGQAHVTDATNASRTMMYNIHDLDWDDDILKALDIPRAMLPEVRSCSEVYGTMNIRGTEIPIAGSAGDQQSALFGQACFEPGEVKNTYGTGCFMLMNTGDRPADSSNGLATTIAVRLGREVQYCLEGSVFVGGAVIQWIRDELGLIRESADSEYFAAKCEDTGGVYIVPAFTGLGAPYWDMDARGAIYGLTRGTGRNEIIRAALESIAYQSNDVLQSMKADTGLDISALKVDGGASANNVLMQFQSDISNVSVKRPSILETTALGAAYLAGLATGVWKDRDEIRKKWTLGNTFDPAMDDARREALYSGWKTCVKRTMTK
jgi:glycerol kinase